GSERGRRERLGGSRPFAGARKSLAVAYLQVPAVRILDPETFERTLIFRNRRHAALFKGRRHFAGIPFVDDPREAADRRAWSGPPGSAGAQGLRIDTAENAIAPAADIHHGLLAVIVPELPAHQGFVKGGLFPVIHHIDGEAFQGERLPAGGIEHFFD